MRHLSPPTKRGVATNEQPCYCLRGGGGGWGRGADCGLFSAPGPGDGPSSPAPLPPRLKVAPRRRDARSASRRLLWNVPEGSVRRLRGAGRSRGAHLGGDVDSLPAQNGFEAERGTWRVPKASNLPPARSLFNVTVLHHLPHGSRIRHI